MDKRPTCYHGPSFQKQKSSPRSICDKISLPKCDRESEGSTLLHIKYFRCSEEFGRIPYDPQPLFSKYAYKESYFQNDQSYQLKEDSSTRCLDGHFGYKGCFPAYTNQALTKKVFGLYTRPRSVFFQSNAFRAEPSSLHFFQNPFLPDNEAKTKRGPYIGILGRPNSVGSQHTGVEHTFEHDKRIITPARFPSKLGKVSSVTNAGCNLARSALVLSSPEIQPDRRFCPQNSLRSNEDPVSHTHVSQTTRTITGLSSLCGPNPPRSKDAVPLYRLVSRQNPICGQRRRISRPIRSSSAPPLVDIQAKSTDSSSSVFRTTIPISMDGRVRHRVWSLRRQRSDLERIMGRFGPTSAYKPERIARSSSDSELTLSSAEGEHFHFNRQHSSHVLYKKPWLKPVSRTPRNFTINFRNMHPEEIDDRSSPHSRDTQYHRRRVITPSTSPDRMGTPSGRISSPLHSSRFYSRAGRNGNSSEFKNSQFHFTFPSPMRKRSRLLCNKPSPVAIDLSLSSSEDDFEGFEENDRFLWSHTSNCTKMAQTTVVPSTPRQSNQGTTSPETSSSDSGRENLPLLYSKLVSLCRLDFMKEIYIARHGSTLANKLSSAFRISTNKQYEFCWRRFQVWLKENDYPQICTNTILQFLDYAFSKWELSPRTVLSYRNAIKDPLTLGFNIAFEEKEFSLLSRSQFLVRPPKRKIIPQWNLESVLTLLNSSRFHTDSCSLEDLLTKCVFLTALASGNRASELAAISRSSIIFRQNPHSIMMAVKGGFLYKNQRINRSPPNITINSLDPPHNDLCPVNTISKNLQATKDSSSDSLFLHSHTGNPLQRPSLSLLICRLIDTACPGSLPRAHDVRKKAASLAWVRGIPPEDITKAAFWVHSSTFISSYLNVSQNPSLPCVALGSSR